MSKANEILIEEEEALVICWVDDRSELGSIKVFDLDSGVEIF